MSCKQYLPALLFLVCLGILLHTSYPSIGWWDSGHYAAAAKSLSIPSAGGSFLYVLLGRLFSILLFFLPTVKAITLVSIVAASLAAVFFYHTLLTLLENLENRTTETVKHTVSFVTALSMPFMYSVWIQANVIRAYILDLFLASILLLCAARIWFSTDEYNKARLFLLIVYIMGINYAAHRLASPFWPVALVLLLFPLRRHLLSPKFWALVVSVFIVSLSLHAYLLVRAQLHPALDLGYTSSWHQLASWIRMRQYGTQSNFLMLFHRRALFWDYQIKYMYLRYLGWNFLGKAELGTFFHYTYLSTIPFLLACCGFVVSLVKRFRMWLFVFIVFFFYSIVLVLYLNVVSDFHLIGREIDRLFLPSFMAFLLWTGIGFHSLFTATLKQFNNKNAARSIALVSLAATGLFILPLNQVVSNRKECDRSRYHFPEDFAYNLLSSCEKDAILFTNGDNDTFPLWYLQEVEGIREDVRVINVSLLNAIPYVKQLRDKEPKLPMELSDQQLEELKPLPWPESQSFSISVREDVYAQYVEELGLVQEPDREKAKTELRFNVPPTIQGTGIRIQDQMILNILEANQFFRPVYFSTTVYPGNLIGLDDYLATVGVVRKLLPVKNVRFLPEEMGKNLLHVYRFRSFDDSSVYAETFVSGLYNIFRGAFIALAGHHLEEGNTEKAKELIAVMNEKLPKWRFSDTQNESVDRFEYMLQNQP